MTNNYVIDKVPNTNMGVESKGDCGKVWYCQHSCMGFYWNKETRSGGMQFL